MCSHKTRGLARTDFIEKIYPGLVAEMKKNGTYYSETFPINKGQLTPGTVADIEAFCNKLENRKDTNFPDMIHYFLSLLQRI